MVFTRLDPTDFLIGLIVSFSLYPWRTMELEIIKKSGLMEQIRALQKEHPSWNSDKIAEHIKNQRS